MNSAFDDRELIEAYNSGELSNWLIRRFGLTDWDSIQNIENQCIVLNNTDQIDLLSLTDPGILNNINDPDFFALSRMICRILPRIDAAYQRILASVDHLVRRGGEDLGANWPNAALRTWCSKWTSRAEAMIDAARNRDDLACQYLTFALEGLHDTATARELALDHHPMNRLAALTALGRLQDDEPASCTKTLEVLTQLAKRQLSDTEKAHLLMTLASLNSRHTSAPTPGLIKLLTDLTTDAEGDATIHAAAHALASYAETLPEDAINALLKTLRNLNPKNRGTVEELDHALSALLSRGYIDNVLGYLIDLATTQGDHPDLFNLGAFLNAVLDDKECALPKTLVTWFLTGVLALCEPLAVAIQRRSPGEGPIIHLPKNILPKKDREQVFLARKISAWLFFCPTSAASAITSIIRHASPSAADEVQSLLVYPLLRNYETARGYLSGIDSKNPAYSRVNEAIRRHDEYLSALRRVPPVVELQPTERQRSIEHLQMTQMMEDARKRAESESVFLSLVTKSVLLYGHRTIGCFNDPTGQQRSTKMNLGSHEVSFPLPRMEIVDPVGLDYMLRTFKAEKLK